MKQKLNAQRRSAGVLTLVERCVNGLRFGFVYLRARGFKVPRKVFVDGKFVPLRYPADHGVHSDFFACFIRNDYGLRQKLPEVRTILDIGANLGFFSIAARRRYPAATIHAYEPNPRILPLLEDNAAQVRVKVYPEAVGSHNGFVAMLDAGSSNQARTEESAGGGIPQVDLSTAIERLGGSVDLLKLDCEGAEWDLFQLGDAWRHVRNLRMEYHLFHGETVAQVEQALESLGFVAIHWEHDKGFGLVWATRPENSHSAVAARD